GPLIPGHPGRDEPDGRAPKRKPRYRHAPTDTPRSTTTPDRRVPVVTPCRLRRELRTPHPSSSVPRPPVPAWSMALGSSESTTSRLYRLFTARHSARLRLLSPNYPAHFTL